MLHAKEYAAHVDVHYFVPLIYSGFEQLNWERDTCIIYQDVDFSEFANHIFNPNARAYAGLFYVRG